ncbi:MAG: hypothetical protein PHX60_13535 [Giesbergeria sp.]|uniref:hypothetical protein n=1 Tax=Giesbergeria sp. TaxID=2818473 RepID=UPI00261333B8|nr:hypothetical protein [Giesbergeria sp.]MDD2610682.1 hypothetical protein [Giesbergeria sp.]
MPQTSRDDTLFNLRYAVRVLERQCTLWRRTGAALKFVSVISGTGAVSAVMAAQQSWAISAGIVFAALQALDVVLDPSSKVSIASSLRREYARLLARQSQYDDAALHNVYQTIVAEDDVLVAKNMRHAAYNDVINEQGRDPDGKGQLPAGVLGWLSD